MGLRFMEREGRQGEKNRASPWFDVPVGQALECPVIGKGEQRRVYRRDHYTAN